MVIETPRHEKNFFNFSVQEFVDYLTIVQKRVVSLQKDRRLAYIVVFKNSGFKAGASMEHSHSQIIAMDKIPQEQIGFINRQKEYFKQHGRVLLDDIVYEETQSDERVIKITKDFVLYAPYASSFGYEVMIVSKMHHSITTLNSDAIDDLARLLQGLFVKYQELFGVFDFNLIFSAQTRQDQEYSRFFIKIIPRFNAIAGLEVASGIYINPFLPEKVAKHLKN